MRIVVDAMGTDLFPAPDVEGAVLAAREYGHTIVLVGDETLVRRELARHATVGLPIEVVHAPQAVSMTDKPGVVGKSKPQSSMHIGMNLVRDGHADAFVSAGNTGAALSIATLFTLKRIPGVKRPSLTAIIRFGGARIVALDMGANADSRPEWLAQFALMGSLYAQHALGLQQPRVALLANGEEETKGNQLTQEAAVLIRELPVHFVGNIEPKVILKGVVDVVVCDGFVGNIMLKSLEGATRAVVDLLRHELRASVRTKAGALLAMPAFSQVRAAIDPNETGGAPLLGVNGVVIIGHGGSNALGIKNAVRQAIQAVQGNLITAIQKGIALQGVESATDARASGG
jgi:glycerol-3-phosphate acyltransferase PlsX